MVPEHAKPRYSGQVESGVFCFVALGNMHDKRFDIQGGDKSTESIRSTRTQIITIGVSIGTIRTHRSD